MLISPTNKYRPTSPTNEDMSISPTKIYAHFSDKKYMPTSPTNKYMPTSPTKNICPLLRQKIYSHFSDKPFLFLSPTFYSGISPTIRLLISLKLSLFGYLIAYISKLSLFGYISEKICFLDKIKLACSYLQQNLSAYFSYLVRSPT